MMFLTFCVLLLLGGSIVFGLVKALDKGMKYRTKFAETCPRCQTVNTFTPPPCQNCGSTSGQFQYRGEPEVPLNTVCGQCMRVEPYIAQCSKCRTHLGWRFANKIKPSEAVKNYMKR